MQHKYKELKIVLGFILTLILGCNLTPSRNPFPVYRLKQKTSKPSWNKSTSFRPSQVKLLNSSFNPISENRGRWEGTINGVGPVSLKLRIFTHDKERLVESRYMGNVTLKGRETPFVFESRIPRERGWEWEIVFVN